jgi:hypothetical protein
MKPTSVFGVADLPISSIKSLGGERKLDNLPSSDMTISGAADQPIFISLLRRLLFRTRWLLVAHEIPKGMKFPAV